MNKSGAQIGAENVDALYRYFEALQAAEEPLPRLAGKPNQTAIARACGFDRQVLYQNPAAEDLLNEYELIDREKHLTKIEALEATREAKAKIDKDRAALEARILQLESENQQLRLELRQFREIERLMTETGRLP
jgi:hypothetical protein